MVLVAKSGLNAILAALPAPWSDWLAAALSLLAAGTTVLMLRFLYLVWTQGPRRPGTGAGLWTPWAILLGIVVCGVWPWPTGLSAGLQTLSGAGIWHAFWPAGAGAIVASATWALVRKTKIGLPFRIPPGDLLQVATRLSNWLGRIGLSLRDRGRNYAAVRISAWRARVECLIARDADRLFDRELRHWGMGGIAFLTVLILAFLLFATA